ncbi:hypothetical protein C7N43_15965 [Sphingobacteriales bacterium UPWRP_1]|nr:hypothetical protein B6N25_03015 [Sphingobacteriales bacterium TSM_CSS]PSJ76025.1 hypothetical protein C7N43_15965 [Sphingobacteriales bacterium UPWRP_1]
MHIIKITLVVIAFFVINLAQAKENIGTTNAPPPASGKNEAADCNASTAQIDLDVNNVRTRLLTGGDLWWDPVAGQPKYEVPKVPPGSDQQSLHSIFAGALWIGGIDQLGQLKVAAQTYRQSGNDFWPGPLDDNGQVTQEICNQFDRFWQVQGSDIDDFLGRLEAAGGTLPPGQVPDNILQWPGKNNPYFTSFDLPANKELAPFFDTDDDGVYDPTKGDYPVIDPNCGGVYADQMIWWIFNDRGNIHTETGGEAIGLEVGAIAFAFATNDEVNNMTFYKYLVENKSTQPIDSVFFGQWVDPDLGLYTDDFVGCVAEEGLGVVYNGDAVDEGYYGSTPPMLGVDFFQGPKKLIGTDANGDPLYQELGMTSFLYYNNDFSITGNPENASHFYGYLAGVWKDGTPFTYGGIGYGGTVPYPFMFPSDPSDNSETAWSECSANNTPFDRRFLQSSGPFQLFPGALNDVIVGVVWVRDGLQYPCPSFEPLVRADKKAQALFDNCFKLQDGPDAPNILIRELDQEIIISLWNDTLISNNAFESYAEADIVLANQGFADSMYTFQGYKLYQLKSPTISPAEYGDPDKARLIAVVDVKDGVTKLINWTIDGTVGALVPELKVEGADNGIVNSFQITDDQFATGSKRLLNNSKYYYSAIAYAYNPHEPYDPANPSPIAQLSPYLEGRNNIKVYTAIPHIPAPQRDGIVLNSEFGDGPEITRISGSGNGGQALELTEESVNGILANGSLQNVVYQGGNGPLNIKIFDPFNVPEADFRLTMEDVTFPSYTQPQAGSLSLDNDNEVFLYSSSANAGVTGFTYNLTDKEGNTDIGSVVIITGAPDLADIYAFDNTAVIAKVVGNTVNIPLFNNDFAPTGVALTLAEVFEPEHGIITAIDNATGVITYQADAGFTGLEKFSYEISAPGYANKKATVYIMVYDDNVLPVDALNAVDDLFSVEAGTGSELDVLGNDTGKNLKGTLVSPKARWTLQNLTSGQVYTSETDIANGYSQAIGGWEDQSLGFTIAVQQQPIPGNTESAVLGSSLSFDDVQKSWMSLVADDEGFSAFNWIRSGTDESSENSEINDNQSTSGDFYDPDQLYETILSGRIAPYCLTNNNFNSASTFKPLAPACSDCFGDPVSAPDPLFTLDNMHSIDLVFTPNKDLWTQCVVVEMGRDANITEGKADKNSLRRKPSWNYANDNYAAPLSGNTINPGSEYYVLGTSAAGISYVNNIGTTVIVNANRFFKPADIDGATSFTAINGAQLYNAADIGRSWFPGYAINLETGQRLNIIFSENSFLGSENGDDLKWNPSSTLVSPQISASRLRVGGEHYVYVMNSPYDGGATYQQELVDAVINADITLKRAVYNEAMWVTLPYLTPGFELLPLSGGIIPTEATIKVRVARPYMQETATNPKLQYEFSFKNLAAKKQQTEVAKSAMDLIKIVPNPYYAFSLYETTQLDNRVRITNLPARANISIFSLDGTLIRTIKVDNSAPDIDTASGGEAGQEQINSVDWDLKNQKNIPVASGVYLIHVQAPDLGEEVTLKFFCISRPIDLDVF